jgi:hypothetical protein
MLARSDEQGRSQTLSLTDTYWSDKTLIDVAGECGLSFQRSKTLSWRERPYAYKVFHFEKLGNQKKPRPSRKQSITAPANQP